MATAEAGAAFLDEIIAKVPNRTLTKYLKGFPKFLNGLSPSRSLQR